MGVLSEAETVYPSRVPAFTPVFGRVCVTLFFFFHSAFIHTINFTDEQMLVYLLNPASVRHVRVIGFYLKRSLELRTEVLLQHK